MSLLFIANYFEELLPTERPYIGTQEEMIVGGFSTIITTADIDSNGNGSISRSFQPNRNFEDRIGERLVLENSVQWSGTWNYTNDFSLLQTFSSES